MSATCHSWHAATQRREQLCPCVRRKVRLRPNIPVCPRTCAEAGDRSDLVANSEACFLRALASFSTSSMMMASARE